MKFIKVATPVSLIVLTAVMNTANANELAPNRVRTTAHPEVIETTRSSPSPTDLQSISQPERPGLEDTLTCEGTFTCEVLNTVCGNVEGGMSQNPDGTQTCTYEDPNHS